MDNIIYIGQDDARQHLFESQYVTPQGMCYNSYVILDARVAVMDTSDSATLDGWLTDLERALDGRQPDYLVIQHLEPDHASGIALAAEKYPAMRLVMSEKAAKMLPLYFDDEALAARVQPVKEGDTLALGAHTLQFVMAPWCTGPR